MHTNLKYQAYNGLKTKHLMIRQSHRDSTLCSDERLQLLWDKHTDDLTLARLKPSVTTYFKQYKKENLTLNQDYISLFETMKKVPLLKTDMNPDPKQIEPLFQGLNT